VFDEKYSGLRALGSTINLKLWYNEVDTICHADFVCGSEELILIDSSFQARVFSLVTQQFR
jgi:hypothetical protein